MDFAENALGWAALPDSGPLAEALLRASWQGALAVVAVWALCRLVPRLPAGLRCGLWWLVCLKLVVGLVWAVEVPAPRALTPVPSPSPPPFRPGEGRPLPLLADLAGERSPLPLAGEGLGVRVDGIRWDLIWGAGVLLQLSALAIGHRRLRNRVRRAEPVAAAEVRGLFAELRSALGVGPRVRLLASPEVETPQVVGLLRPAVLLPADAVGRLSGPELALTLGHELLHLRRGDLWLGWVPALAQRLFFFHPLAALAAREYAVAREAACDAAVLRVLAPAPEVYGRLLLKLGVTPGLPRLAAAGGSPSYRTLKRRLEMLQNASDRRRIHPAVWCLVAMGAAAALVPFRMVAEERAQAAGSTARHHDDGGDESYVVLLGNGDSVMSGSIEDVRRAKKLLGDTGIWFERDGRSYVIRDAALTQQIEALFRPQTELGEQQAKLGEQQAKLGAQQAQLGAKMAELGAQMAAAAAEQTHHSDQEDAALDAKMEELDRQMEALDDEMEKFNTPQEELGNQQEELGKQQEALGEQQEAVAEKAEAQLRQLFDKAVADGTAQPAP